MTKIVNIPISHCDEAVGNKFGGQFCCIMDAISGYNQILVAKYSQHNLDFAGPKRSKYTYNVMLFGPINGAVIFIVFLTILIHLEKSCSPLRYFNCQQH